MEMEPCVSTRSHNPQVETTMAIVQVPVSKGKATIEVNTDQLPDEFFQAAVLLGLKEMVNRGMSKITGSSIPDEAERKEAAMAKAAENVQAIYDGDTKKIRLPSGAKAKKASGKIMTEARRIARNAVKDMIKQAGGKVSHYEAKEITAGANALLESEDGEAIMAEAKANVEAREAKQIKLDLVKTMHVSPKLVAADEARKASKKDIGSAGQVRGPKPGRQGVHA